MPGQNGSEGVSEAMSEAHLIFVVPLHVTRMCKIKVLRFYHFRQLFTIICKAL